MATTQSISPRPSGCGTRMAREEYTIVRSAQALVVRGRISMESPVGRALLGRRRGDRIEVRTPGGVRLLTIVGVATSEAQVERGDPGSCTP